MTGASTAGGGSGYSQRPTRIGNGLHARIVESLGREILDGAIPVGHILYADQICQRFGISRSIVRESVRTLSSMGLVESRPKVGTRVLPVEQWDLLNPELIRWRGAGRNASTQQRELLELRLGVEPVAARLASRRMSEAARSAVLDAAQEMQRAYDAQDPYRFFEADARFHWLLLEGSGNLVIAQLTDTVEAVLLARSQLASTKLVQPSVDLHMRLARALDEGEADVAERTAALIIADTMKESEEYGDALA